MTDKDETIKNTTTEGSATGPDNNEEKPAPEIPNPFEKGHAELSPEALESLEHFKEAQTERD